MRATACDECGERERTGFQRDGVCRECRGVTVPERKIGRTRERGEHVDHAEMESRARVIHNDRFQGDDV